MLRSLAVFASLGGMFMLCPAGTFGAESTTVTLNGLEIGLDGRSGGIASMSCPATGKTLEALAGSAGLVDLAYPVKEFVPLRLSSAFSEARVIKGKDEVTIIWDKLAPSRSNVALPEGKVSARATLRAAPDGRSTIVTCHIDNQSTAPVQQVLFPDLHGLKPIAGTDQTVLRFAAGVTTPFARPTRPADGAFYAQCEWGSFPPGGTPVANALRWLDLGGLKGGLSFFEKKWGTGNRPRVLTQRTESDPNSLRLAWEHKVTIAPGESWHSGEFWLTPHQGGWAKGIEPYRAYARKACPPRELPRHVRDEIGFQTIWMMQAAETDPAHAAFKFKDIPSVARDAKAHGISELVLWGWCNYFELPIQARKELGTREEFIEAVRECKEMGVNVVPFLSVLYMTEACAKRYDLPANVSAWTYHPDLVPRDGGYYVSAPYPVVFWKTTEQMGPENALWQKDLFDTLTDWVNAGVPSFSWDQFNSGNKGDEKPPLVAIVEKLRPLAQAKDPQATFSGESYGDIRGNLEWDTQVLDYTWNWEGFTGEITPVLNVLHSPRINCNVEYSPGLVKQVFCEGQYMNLFPKKMDQPNGTAMISDEPAVSAALKEVVPLRRQFLSYFTKGNALGYSVLSERVPAMVRGYQLDGKLLLIVLNDLGSPQQVKLQSDLSLWLSSTKKYQVKYYDSTGKLLETTSGSGDQWSGTTRPLGVLELAFFEIGS